MQKIIFTAKEVRDIVSMAPTTSLGDVRAVRDNFTTKGHGVYHLNDGVSIEWLREDCRLKALDRRIKKAAREQAKRV